MAGKEVIVALVGCKSDLEAERKAPLDFKSKLATLYGLPYYETSAKEGDNIKSPFVEAIAGIIKSSSQS